VLQNVTQNQAPSEQYYQPLKYGKSRKRVPEERYIDNHVRKRMENNELQNQAP